MKKRLLFVIWVIGKMISIGLIASLTYIPYWIITGKSSFQLIDNLFEPLCPNVD
jgi:hypothetical protein